MKQIFYFNSCLQEQKSLLAKKNHLKLTFKYTACLFIAIITALQSCSKMNDLHDPYLNEGEYVYAEKVDTVLVYPGKNRIKFEMHISSESIETARIYWNNYTDSVDVDIANQRGVFDKIVEGLNEQQYVFNFVTFDNYSNQSLPYEILGQVYGDNFQNLVSNRTIIVEDEMYFDSDNQLIINWSPDVTNVAHCEVSYINNNNDGVTIQIPPEENISFLPNFKSDLKYVTALQPTPTSIDLFYAETIYLNKEIIFDYASWSIDSFSTQHGGNDNKVANILDGNQNSRWHTLAGGSYPHWAIIDLGGLVTFTEVEILRSTFDGGGDNRAPDKFQFEVSTDNMTWIDLGIFDFNRHTNDGQFYSIAPPNPIRYIRFTGTEGGGGNNMVLGAIKLYK